jgi:MFS family permease
MALLGGALADRMDRRRLLLLDQAALVTVAAVLCVAALAGHPPVLALYVLGGLLAGFGALQNVARTAIVPNLVTREDMPAALALNFGLFQLTMVFGPGLGGLLIAAGGVESAYGVDALSCLAMVAALRGLGPQLPAAAGAAVGAVRTRIGRSIGDGLRFVRHSPALLGSFVIDLNAMTFGMPRALFPVLAVSVYGAGAAGTGLLFAAVSTGAAIAALTTGWLGGARRLGRITVAAVCVWGLAIATAGLAGSLWLAAGLLALAGAADSVSAVCRSIINQSVTPDAMRGRMSSVFSLVVTSGPRLGDVEAGVVASLTSVRTSVVSGGLACVAGAMIVAATFPALIAYDASRALTGE